MSVLHENGALYALLCDSLHVFLNESEPGSAGAAKAKTASLLRRVCSVVAIGVLLRDYDFQRFPPDSDSDFDTDFDSDDDASAWLLQHRGTCAQTIGELLSAALLPTPSHPSHPNHPSSALGEAYRCQLLRSVLRAYSRAIDVLPESVVALYSAVSVQRKRV